MSSCLFDSPSGSPLPKEVVWESAALVVKSSRCTTGEGVMVARRDALNVSGAQQDAACVPRRPTGANLDAVSGASDAVEPDEGHGTAGSKSCCFAGLSRSA